MNGWGFWGCGFGGKGRFVLMIILDGWRMGRGVRGILVKGGGRREKGAGGYSR